MFSTIKVRHTIQMGHRLWSIPGRCQQLHGHTWNIILGITGEVTSPDGMFLNYHDIKRVWRTYLDTEFDHHFAFDGKDPLVWRKSRSELEMLYPGSVIVTFIPTVENLAAHWAAYAATIWGSKYTYSVELWEGENNCAIASIE